MSILTDKKVVMNYSDMKLLSEAIENVLGKDINSMPSNEGWEVCVHFDNMLGIRMWQDYKGRVSRDDSPLPIEWHEFFTKLCGSHGKTILKVYRAKRGLTKCPIK